MFGFGGIFKENLKNADLSKENLNNIKINVKNLLVLHDMVVKKF